jgi:DNA ligase D-like protein (predicted polymerase)
VASSSPAVDLQVGDRTVRLSNPDRVYFPARGETKLDLARYYLSVADGVVRALRGRPCMLHRFPTGVTGEKVHQKRLPRGAPDWVPTVRVHFPRWNRYADELCVAHPADVIWAVQMSTVEFHPWNSRAPEVEKPDEWRIDLDPMPMATYPDVRRVAHVAHEVLDELGATGWPKTSGGKGMHIYVRIAQNWGWADVRRAAHAFAKEVERRSAGLVDLTWWRKDRDPASTSPSPPCPPASPNWATCTPASTTRCSCSTSCWSGRTAMRVRAPELPRRSRRTSTPDGGAVVVKATFRTSPALNVAFRTLPTRQPRRGGGRTRPRGRGAASGR